MSGAARRRLKRALSGCLAVSALTAGAAGCSTSSTVFGGNQPAITGSILIHRTTVHTGQLVHAELVLHNSSGHPILLWQGCSSQFIELVLSNGSVTTGAAWRTPLCRPGVKFVAHPGTTIYHLVVAAVYRVWSGHGSPDLPRGTYTVTVAADSTRLQSELTDVRSAHLRVIR